MVADGSNSGGAFFGVGGRHGRSARVGVAGRTVVGFLGVLLGLQVAICVGQSPDRSRAPWQERQAASPSREILLGTTDKSDDADPEGRTQSAARVLASAGEALRQGDIMLARRRLEVLIETYPETPAAEMAREELVSIFGGRRDSRSLRSVQDGQSGGRSGYIADRTGNAEPVPSSRDDRSPAARKPRSGEDELAMLRRRQLQDERRLQMLGYEFQMAAGDRVFFAETSSDLGARARAVLVAQARWLGRHADLPIIIEAHADDHRGNRVLDTQLSQRRARAVVERLVEEGVDRARIVIHAFGRDRPVAICQAPECAAQNCRVVVRVGGGRDGSDSRRNLEEPALATAPSQTRRGPSD